MGAYKKEKKAKSSTAIIDSQSVKTTILASETGGFGASKKIKGRKHHILNDTLGLMICVVAHAAGI